MIFKRSSCAPFAALFTLCGLWVCVPAQALPGERIEAGVRRIIDGDTFELDSGERVRLIGVDTPEYQPWKGRADVYGREAADFARTLLKDRRVTLESDVEERDKYGRSLAYLYLSDGTFVNEKIIREGYAYPLNIPPNVRYADEFKRWFDEAREAKRGLWSDARR